MWEVALPLRPLVSIVFANIGGHRSAAWLLLLLLLSRSMATLNNSLLLLTMPYDVRHEVPLVPYDGCPVSTKLVMTLASSQRSLVVAVIVIIVDFYQLIT